MTQLLEVQGYYATGLNQLIQESSTPRGSLYFHFPGGKEELASEAVRRAGTEISHNLEATLNTHVEIGDAIAAFVFKLAEELETSDFRKGCPVANVAMETAAISDRLRQTCEQIYSEWHNLLQQRLQKAGLQQPEADSWSLLIWASVEGALLLSRTYRSTEPLETVATHLRNLLIRL